jgi:alpha-D-ribose 1-methylphosphonate 5-triphosphate synthase subunit PhnG
MALLARAPLGALETAWQELEAKPDYVLLRKPETGLCMVRARAGGVGMRFNLGEMTMTRAAVRLASGTVGHGIVAGRKARHAELAALFDGLLQEPRHRPALERRLIDRIESALEAARQKVSAKVAATKVDFLALVRGED